MSNQKNSKLAFVPSVNDQIDLLINTLQTIKSCKNEKGKRQALNWVIKTEAKANKSYERKQKMNEAFKQWVRDEAEIIEIEEIKGYNYLDDHEEDVKKFNEICQKIDKIIEDKKKYEDEKIDVPDDVSQISEDNIIINYLLDYCSDDDSSSDGSSAEELKRMNNKSSRK